VSLAATRTVTYDPCAPTVSVVSHDLDDERDYEAGWLKDSARPCLFRRATSPAKTTLAYDLASGGAGPTVYKYAINTADVPYFFVACILTSPTDISLWEQLPPSGTAYASDSNAIEWWLDVRDNISVASVSYRIKPPGGSFGAATPAPVKSMMGSTVTHAIKLTSGGSLDTPGAAGDLGGNAPGLIDKEGTWEIEVTAVDSAGNVKTPMTIKFTYVPLAGPVLLKDDLINVDSPGFPTASYKYLDKSLFGLESTSAASVSPLFGAADNTIVLRRYKVLNGTRFPANVKLTVGTVSTSGSRTINERNPFKQNLSGAGPNCNPNAFNTANNVCLNPVPADTSTTTSLPNNPGFIKAIELWYKDASSKAPFACPECANEWTIDASSAITTQPGKATAYVLTSALTVLWDGDASPVPVSDIMPDIAAPDPALFGIQKMIWGETWTKELDWKPYHVLMRQINVRVKYLQSFLLTVSGSVTAATRLPTSPAAALPVHALPDATSPLPAGLTYSTTENASVPAYVPPPMF
jgi:hypothetical protein